MDQSKQSKPTMVVVVPDRPPIDKYWAFQRVRLHFQDRFNLKVRFCNKTTLENEDLESWHSECSEGVDPIVIDIGPYKYDRCNMPSASAMIDSELRSISPPMDAWLAMLDQINQNNRSGHLKKMPHSLAFLVREAYEMYEEQDTNFVWNHMAKAIDSYFWIYQKNWTEIENPAHHVVFELFQGFNVRGLESVNPFTLPEYLANMFCAGCPDSEIIETISWWLKVQKWSKERRHAAGQKTFRPVFIEASGRRYGLVHVADKLEGNAFAQQYLKTGRLAIAALRNSATGNITILISKSDPHVDLDPLVIALTSYDGEGRWFHKQQFGEGQALLNGNDMYSGVKPTSISDYDLLQMMADKVRWTQSPPPRQSGGRR